MVTITHTPVLVIEVLLLFLQLVRLTPPRLLQELRGLLNSLPHHGVTKGVELLGQHWHLLQAMQTPQQGHQRLGPP